ncbi:hypothetical protein QYF36_016621 [Acer negundo]|nr:hypothetical protein QYF36_016621 [Acer negundo]
MYRERLRVQCDNQETLNTVYGVLRVACVVIRHTSMCPDLLYMYSLRLSAMLSSLTHYTILSLRRRCFLLLTPQTLSAAVSSSLSICVYLHLKMDPSKTASAGPKKPDPTPKNIMGHSKTFSSHPSNPPKTVAADNSAKDVVGKKVRRQRSSDAELCDNP